MIHIKPLKNSDRSMNMNENGFDFGTRLRHVRETRGLTQGDMADIIGITLRNYQYYERGEHRLPTSTLYCILHALDISADYFFGFVSNPDSHKKTNSRSWVSYDAVSEAEKNERKKIDTIADIRAGLFEIMSMTEINADMRSRITEIIRSLEELSMLSKSNAEMLRNSLGKFLNAI